MYANKYKSSSNKFLLFDSLRILVSNKKIHFLYNFLLSHYLKSLNIKSIIYLFLKLESYNINFTI